MANRSNQSLIDDIVALSAKLGKTVEPDSLKNLKNPELEAQLDSLQKEAPEAPKQSPEQVKAEADANARAAEVVASNKAREDAAKLAADGTAEYLVAPGLSITCRRGIVDGGQSISASDFHHPELDLKDLLKRGAIVKAK